MAMRTYQMYSAGNQANAANITILANGVLVGVSWGLSLDSAVDNAVIRAELSKSAASTVNTSGIQNQIVSFCWGTYVNQATAASIMDGTHMFLDAGLDFACRVGDVLYLNLTNAQGGACNCLVKVRE